MAILARFWSGVQAQLGSTNYLLRIYIYIGLVYIYIQAQLGFRPGGHQRLDGKGGEASEPAT